VSRASVGLDELGVHQYYVLDLLLDLALIRLPHLDLRLLRAYIFVLNPLELRLDLGVVRQVLTDLKVGALLLALDGGQLNLGEVDLGQLHVGTLRLRLALQILNPPDQKGLFLLPLLLPPIAVLVVAQVGVDALVVVLLGDSDLVLPEDRLVLRSVSLLNVGEVAVQVGWLGLFGGVILPFGPILPRAAPHHHLHEQALVVNGHLLLDEVVLGACGVTQSPLGLAGLLTL